MSANAWNRRRGRKRLMQAIRKVRREPGAIVWLDDVAVMGLKAWSDYFGRES